MGKALIKGTLIGGIIIFVWMLISWTVIPWHCWTMKEFIDETEVAQTLLENTTEDGFYPIPNICHLYEGEMKDKLKELKEGPFAFISIRREGYDFKAVKPHIISFIIWLISALIVTYILLHCRLGSYWKRVWVVTLLGLLVGVAGMLPGWTWWGFPFDFVFLNLLDFVIAWFLAGLALGAIAKT